jgi:transcription termination factor Rho
VPFADRTAIAPSRPLALPDDDAGRALGGLAPWWRGNRVLITAPRTWPTARFFADLAAGLQRSAPDVRPVLCLLDQRPEDIAAARARTAAAGCPVVATPFAAPPERHLALADTALGRALRQVEAGVDVVLLVDSLTAMVRARGRVATPSGGFAAPGLAAEALLPAKRLFAAARQCAEGGSLTVIATVVADASSVVDDAIARELQPFSNSDVAVDAELVAKGAEPPFDPQRTRTRPEDDPRPQAEREWRRALDQRLAGLPVRARHAAWKDWTPGW